jgi:hypothetical protein
LLFCSSICSFFFLFAGAVIVLGLGLLLPMTSLHPLYLSYCT